jgi:hypothetical protein
MMQRYTEISIPELDLSVEPGIIIGAHAHEYRLISAIRSTNTFNHTCIKTKNIHVLIALDMSGSMGTIISGFGDPDMSVNRIECCISSINKLLEFLRVLSENGIEVYFTLVGFNTSVVPIFEHHRVPSDPSELCKMQDTCNLLHPSGATNVGSLLEYVSGIRRKYEMDDTNNTDEFATYSILLSDGYITMGPHKDAINERKSSNPFWVFNTSIGIGEPTEYDNELLNTLTKEDECRGCACSDDLYDNLLSSIFQHMDIHAKEVKWTGDMNGEYPLRGGVLRYGQFIAASTPTIFARYEPTIEVEMKLQNISESFHSDSFANSIRHGIWTVCYSIEKQENEYHVRIRVVADTMPAVQRMIRYQQRYSKIVEDYLKIIKEFNTYDLDSRIMVNELYLHFSKWMTDIDAIEYSPVMIQMKTIIDEMWKRIEQLYQQMNDIPEESIQLNSISDVPQVYTGYRSLLFPFMRNASPQDQNTIPSQPVYQTPSLLTPSQTISSIQMMRSQSAAGNYAFIGRMMTENYSQSSL